MGKKKKQLLTSQWQEYRNAVYETKSKSQDDFEKYINLISSGALALTITLLDKIVPISDAVYIWIIAIGWVLLALTLLLNLYSHHKSIEFAEQTISEIDNEYFERVSSSTEKNNSKIRLFNSISLYSLFCGVILIIIFVTINLYNYG